MKRTIGLAIAAAMVVVLVLMPLNNAPIWMAIFPIIIAGVAVIFTDPRYDQTQN